MRNKIIAAFAGVALLTTTGLSMATEKNSDILVSAGPETLTRGQFNIMLESMPPQLQMMMASQPELRKGMLTKWAEFSILAQEAAASGIGKDETVQQKIKEISNRILVEEYVNRHTGKGKVSAKMVEDYYKEKKAEFSHGEEVQAQHILIRLDPKAGDAEQAKAKKTILSIQKQLKKGKDFAALAKEYSEDPGSKENGGQLGFFGRGSMVKPFEDVAFATKKGKVSEPVKTDFGWHLIKITDRKEAGSTPLAQVKEQIENSIKQQKQQQEVEAILTRLKKSYPIEVKE